MARGTTPSRNFIRQYECEKYGRLKPISLWPFGKLVYDSLRGETLLWPLPKKINKAKSGLWLTVLEQEKKGKFRINLNAPRALIGDWMCLAQAVINLIINQFLSCLSKPLFYPMWPSIISTAIFPIFSCLHKLPEHNGRTNPCLGLWLSEFKFMSYSKEIQGASQS